MHIMIDEPDDIMDYNVAHHIVNVHQHQEQAVSPEFTTVQLQRYIAYARSLKPQVWLSFSEVRGRGFDVSLLFHQAPPYHII